MSPKRNRALDWAISRDVRLVAEAPNDYQWASAMISTMMV